MQKPKFVVLCLLSLALVLATPTPGQAEEQLGEIQLSDFLVEPTYRSTERSPATGASLTGFGLGNSYFAAQWKLHRTISGRIQLASTELINRPDWLSPTVDRNLAFVEAYAQTDLLFGTIRGGLLPVYFGYDGGTAETLLWYPRTAIYRERLMVLRDYGLNFSIANNGFFTDVIAHNGEGGEDQDRRLWQTARWGWRGGAGVQMGLSGAVGYFKLPTGLDTKSRIGNAFFGLDYYGIGITAEGTLGERKNSASQYQFLDWYLAFRHALGKNWGFLTRYEFYDPSSRVQDDASKKGLIGLYLNNDTNTSRLSAVFTKNWEESEEIANDEVLITWHVTSAYFSGGK